MEETGSDLLNLNRQQMYAGLGMDGKPISPKYSEDPYFKTVEAARKYAEWKMKISPYPGRGIDTPNLFITGRYHMSLKLVVNESTYSIVGTDVNATDIEKKFKTALGLNDESRAIYRHETMNPLLVRRLKIFTGCG